VGTVIVCTIQSQAEWSSLEMPFGLGECSMLDKHLTSWRKLNVIEVKNDTKTIEITTRAETSNSEEREGTTNVSLEKSEDWVTARTRFGH
jgi:hypothetical protein